ncbi:hypothetical protein NX801_04345 [Streptomyces sp. LP05-1]|uniref:Uncharacterized protein n=1 Tax=Streptomyces pyxinae TaxID=2970734 RepID=A0ABT2CBW5_9ACTN|nr:hypothetical protein [Streptomyces sp. LP05-1]MCS0634902.1 hypothetical protein [Streptomyces sp. LP05-1]
MENKATTDRVSECDVTVQLSECGREEARAVFGALEQVFSACDSGAPGPEHGDAPEPTVWTATFDSTSARSGEPTGRPRLGGEVAALLTGGQQAVDAVEQALARVFDVRSSEDVAGEHEKETRLLLAGA